MKIISSYWSNKKEQEISENAFSEHVKTFELKKVFIGFEQIKNFKIEIENERMILYYAMRKNAKLKYYCNFLNHSVVVNKGTIIFLQDKNWIDFDNKILNKETLNLLN